MNINVVYQIIAFSGFSILDGLTTFEAISSGKFYEWNPVLSFLMRYVGLLGTLIITRSLLIGLFVFYVLLYGEISIPIVLVGLFGGIVVANNLRILSKENLDPLRSVKNIYWNFESGYVLGDDLNTRLSYIKHGQVKETNDKEMR